MSVRIAVVLAGIEITAENDTIILEENGVELAAELEHGLFFPRGDDGDDDLFAVITAAFDAVGANTYGLTHFEEAITGNHSVSRSPATPNATLTLQRVTGALNFRALWLSDDTTFDPSLLGFAAEKAAADAAPESSTKSAASIWVPTDIHEFIDPEAEWEVAEVDMADGSTEIVRRGDEREGLIIRWNMIDGRRVHRRFNADDQDATLQAFLNRFNDGCPIELLECVPLTTTLLDIDNFTRVGDAGGWLFSAEAGRRVDAQRVRTGMNHWDIQKLFRSRAVDDDV